VIPRSIRWRLPLSYAAIALLAALALGIVLLTTLRSYYLQRELSYLTDNARAISASISPLIEADLSSAAIQSQLKSYSFLSQTRVRLLDEVGQVLADSGGPHKRREVLALSVEVPSKPSDRPLELAPIAAEVEFKVEEEVSPRDPVPAARSGEHKRYRAFIVVEDAHERTVVTQTVVLTATGPADILQSVGAAEHLIEPPDLISRIPVLGTLYGFGLSAEIASDGPRSHRVVIHPLYDVEDNLTGYVELSEGPAYGRDILSSVAWGWAVASGAAVLLAGGVGWVISRRLSAPLLTLTQVTGHMAEGNLSARADTTRQDEFGLLAHSFNEMADRVEETVVALRRFVADAAHELHTPLTALRTNLELAALEEGTADQLTALERAQTQVERLQTLSSALLDLSRLEANAGKENHALMDLSVLVQEASEVCASRAEQTGLSFSLDLPQGAVMIQGNRSQLRRALGNLLDNAIKFTPQGGSVSVGLRRREGQAELRVEDTGIGIPPGDLPHLFGHFHRGRNAVAYPGSGLGLAIARTIVEGHSGQVMAESTSQGTCFLVRLPSIE
jgi:signal transduction histidine kinase